ncbi:hypothetical protein ACFW82_38110, partial [Streptomyces sp. NPDC058728]
MVHEHPHLGGVPHDLRDLMAWCLAKRPADRPSTVELIAAAHAHPAVGPRPEFTDGWLPRPVRDEVGGRGSAGRGDSGWGEPGWSAPAHLQATRAAPAHTGAGDAVPAAPTGPGAGPRVPAGGPGGVP